MPYILNIDPATCCDKSWLIVWLKRGGHISNIQDSFHLDPLIIRAALCKDQTAYNFLVKKYGNIFLSMLDESFVLSLLIENYEAPFPIPLHLRKNKQFVMKVVTSCDPDDIRSRFPEIRNYSHFFKLFPKYYPQASQSVKNIKEIVLKAIRVNLDFLYYVPNILLDDLDVAYVIITKAEYVTHIQYISSRLRGFTTPPCPEARQLFGMFARKFSMSIQLFSPSLLDVNLYSKIHGAVPLPYKEQYETAKKLLLLRTFLYIPQHIMMDIESILMFHTAPLISLNLPPIFKN